MSKTVEARTVHDFKASAEQVFDAWLDPDMVRAWSARAVLGKLGFDVRRVEIDARVGGKFTFSDMRDDGEAVHWGYYIEIDRPRKLVFSWFTSDEEEREDNSVVTLVIEPKETGCRATIVHRMDARWKDWVDQTSGGWHHMLSQVAAEVDA